MEKNRTIIAVLLSVGVMLAWIGVNSYLRSAHPEWFPPQGQQQAAAPQPDATAATPDTQPTTMTTTPAGVAPTTGPTATGPALAAGPNPTPAAAPAPAGNGLSVAPADAGAGDAAPALGSATLDDPTHAMQLRLSPTGGAIDAVTLNQFRRSEDFKKPPKERGIYVFQEPYAGHGYTRSMATRSVRIGDRALDLTGATWTLAGTNPAATRSLIAPGQPGGRTTATGQSATYTTTVLQDGRPALELTKTFTMFPKAAVNLGYEVTVDYAVRNVSGGELTVAHTMNGPTLPPPEAARPPDRQLVAGYRAADGTIVIPSPRAVEEFSAGARAIDITKDAEGRPVAWAGTSSVYFDAFVLFEQPNEIARVAAEMKDFETQLDANKRPVLVTFETVPQKLAAGETRTLSMSAFFGPRWRQVLNADYYAAANVRDFDQTLVVKSGPCGFCAFDWLILSLVWLLNSFQWLAGGFPPIRNGDWGIAIILLVALVRTLLHPITKRSQLQMMKMGKMGPELAKLKEKYGDDKEAFTKAQMQLMKDQGIGPLLGCLPMFLQMPIWIALWQALQSTFELRQAPFLWGYTWIRDLSKPDYLIKFDWANPPTLFMVTLDGFNLLPILMSVVFFIQITIQNRLQPKGTPEQEAQKKMMVWMSTLLFPLFLYNGPSGLNLYILTSTLVGIVESKVIRDHIKQREAAEKALGPVVVDARPTRAARRNRDGKLVEEPEKPTGLLGFLQKLQERVEEARGPQERRPGGGKAK